MSDKTGSQAQPATMYNNYMAPNRGSYNNYQGMSAPSKYAAGYNTAQLADAIAGMNLGGQPGYNNMQGPKSSMTTSGQDMDANGSLRGHYGSGPVMVLPHNQVFPLSSIYAQQQNHAQGQTGQLSYVPTGMFPNFVGSNNMLGGGMSNYSGWPYGLPGQQLPGLDPDRRGSWSSNEETGPVTPVVGGSHSADYYTAYPWHNNTSISQATAQYIAGPIQPMKCSDNKSYEMTNLDELTQREPPIPRAVPALWTNQDEMSLAKCLQNPEGITNIYIRGFMPDTTDEDLENYAARFGEIESCKAIIEQETGKCKGFGFVLYYSPAAAENCIRGFFHLGFQASYAQKSRNSRLKDLEDRTSTNIYCTGVPIEWNELDLAKHFLPYCAVSTKICRDAPSGVSKEVGFARFETRESAERVIKDSHAVINEHTGVKLYLRFADTKAQKQLKQQSQERRTWRSREYSYSVEHTPSPTLGRLANVSSQTNQVNQVSPYSHASYQSPAGNGFTPATSVSPPEAPGIKNSNHAVSSLARSNASAWPTSGNLPSIQDPNAAFRGQIPVPARYPVVAAIPPRSFNALPIKPDVPSTKSKTPSPQKLSIKSDGNSNKENMTPPQAR